MSGITLIPFGLYTKTGELIDVGNVSQGSKCNCICPSCKTPLVARQGEHKEWHFAHSPRKEQKKTEKPCEFSFAVSIRLMIKQLSEQGLVFLLPAFTGKHTEFDAPSGRSFEVTYPIANETQVTLQYIEVETKYENSVVDILAKIGSFELVIYITYKDRVVPDSLYRPTNSNCGVVELDARFLAKEFQEVPTGQYTKALQSYLSENYLGKKWIYHPRKQKTLNQLKKHIKDNKNAYYDKYLPTRDPFPLIKSRLNESSGFPPSTRHSCVMCGSFWTGPSAYCEDCETHLYTNSNQ
ncbi:competence protein CoiA family protein [Aliiglaciecola lipolytica]|uniref:Competence protein CoiA-like N-terminal domain-containing protein n=1 Tax=Aliiglaciecola lipolytica E3 TaxID=1127673 RepID=K6XSQ4_9ALTE|nr:competence protein CoiA family protein [Aliiglaciecola lipolytica]GAC14711.1 hypothetical protein GLIP_2083 [Aliiglaciecola lipolytica E3]